MQPRFLVDENCAQVAKWLRFYGLDAKLVLGLSDKEIADLALQETRILITRDQELWHMHPGPAICLYSDELSEQLRTIFQNTSLPQESLWFSRCVLCNVSLELLSTQEVETEPHIPPKVKESHKEFWRCPNCKRLYWEGSHFDRTHDYLKAIAKEV